MCTDIRDTFDNEDLFKYSSKELLDFLRKILEPYPQKRMTVQEAFEHPWILNSPEFKIQMPKSLIKDLFK